MQIIFTESSAALRWANGLPIEKRVNLRNRMYMEKCRSCRVRFQKCDENVCMLEYDRSMLFRKVEIDSKTAALWVRYQLTISNTLHLMREASDVEFMRLRVIYDVTSRHQEELENVIKLQNNFLPSDHIGIHLDYQTGRLEKVTAMLWKK